MLVNVGDDEDVEIEHELQTILESPIAMAVLA